MSARSFAEVEAQCRAEGVDLRVSGRGMTECMDRMLPFCPEGVTAEAGDELPRCAGAGPSPAKAAALLDEALSRKVDGPPWLLIGGGVAVGAVALWLIFR